MGYRRYIPPTSKSSSALGSEYLSFEPEFPFQISKARFMISERTDGPSGKKSPWTLIYPCGIAEKSAILFPSLVGPETVMGNFEDIGGLVTG